VRSVRIVGGGRAGRSLANALARSGWSVADVVGRGDDPAQAADGIDLLVLAVPDGAVASLAAAVAPVSTTVVAHLAGSLGLDVLAPHPRRAAIHPLISLPDAELGAARLLAGGWFAVAGDRLAEEVVASLGGRWFPVADRDRALYHAAAVISSNHLVALLAQAERLARRAGVPFDAYLDLAAGTLANVQALGPKAALTGPAMRGDTATIERHLAALPREERATYQVMSDECRRLAASGQAERG
jgi:predicted short-subunit dehydrogenase-like oxidoreductase (DUF2520 family)